MIIIFASHTQTLLVGLEAISSTIETQAVNELPSSFAICAVFTFFGALDAAETRSVEECGPEETLQACVGIDVEVYAAIVDFGAGTID